MMTIGSGSALRVACRSADPRCLAKTAAASKAATATTEGSVKSPSRSDTIPAKSGPMIWPRPKAQVISANARRGSPVTSACARTRPSAVIPTKVPPTSTAASSTPPGVGQAMLASTPAASTRQARAKAEGMPNRPAIRLHSAIDGAAARPNTIQITGSSALIAGVPRTIATRNVAVMM